MIYLEAISGLVVLLLGGDFLVRGSVSLARRLGVSTLLIGLTVVACGTSAPELVVSLNAALSGAPGLSIGNVVGSNVANILLVLGVPAIIAPIASSDAKVDHTNAFMIGASALFIALCWFGPLKAWQGGILLVLFFSFLAASYGRAMRDNREAAAVSGEVQEIHSVPGSMGATIAITLGGLVGLAAGSHLLVDGATGIARTFGLSEAVIGVTLIAVGTSLPELATSLMAALHRHGDVAVGNVIGSNLFNILGVMGLTALVVPVPVPAKFLSFDLWVMLATTLVLLPFIAARLQIGRMAGLVFALSYGVYIAAQFFGMSELGS